VRIWGVLSQIAANKCGRMVRIPEDFESVEMRTDTRIALSAACSGHTGMKKAQVISLLQQGNGASLDEIIALTGWLMHRVTVVRDGFEWQGKQYRSLSDIAKRTTGTTWSGPRFFGLREPIQKAAP
jgi:hypothetical protein